MEQSTKLNPIIEFYEYQIHKYKPIDRFNGFIKDENALFKFGNIVDSDENSCQRIGIEGAITDEPDTHRSTCDPITNEVVITEHSGGYKHFITENKKNPLPIFDTQNPFPIYEIENLYNNYKEFLAKYEVHDNLTKKSIDLILLNLRSAISVQTEYIKKRIPNNDTGEQFTKYINSNYNTIPLDILKTKNINDSILLQVNITNKTKIVMFGDFHGSFHTFFRLLCRLHKYDILDLDTFKIKDNYKIIFLGDVLDRGRYCLDIINIIFKLIHINNTEDDLKVIYNRGNHEVYNIFEGSGFSDEMTIKLGDRGVLYFFSTYLHFLNILPAGVVFNCEGNLFWCSHGGFPISYLTNNFLDGFKDDKIIYLTGSDSTHIKWNDFGEEPTGEEDYVDSSRGGDIFKFTAKGTNKFLNRHNINFIIRGHQDSYGNSILFKNIKDDNNIDVIGNPNMIDVDQFLFYNKSIKTYEHRVNGPIARLRLNKELANKFNYFPVLTISTNTDAGRHLNSDSFALLRFDIVENEQHKFENILNSIKKINGILQSQHINMSSIFIRNLDIIHDMLKLINNDIFTTYNGFICELNEETRRNCKENISKITFILDIFNDCKEFITYYNEKYLNLQTKINKIVQKQKIADFQKIHLDNYIRKYGEKIKECEELIDIINKSIASELEDIKIKRDTLSNITNINERVKIIRESEGIKKQQLKEFRKDITPSEIVDKLKEKLNLLQSGSYNIEKS